MALGQPCPEGLSGPHETAAGVLDGEENRMLKAQFAELDCDVVQRIGRLNAGSKVASEMWQAVWMTVGSKDRRVCGGSLNEARTAGSAARRRHVHKDAVGLGDHLAKMLQGSGIQEIQLQNGGTQPARDLMVDAEGVTKPQTLQNCGQPACASKDFYGEKTGKGPTLNFAPEAGEEPAGAMGVTSRVLEHRVRLRAPRLGAEMPAAIALFARLGCLATGRQVESPTEPLSSRRLHRLPDEALWHVGPTPSLRLASSFALSTGGSHVMRRSGRRA